MARLRGVRVCQYILNIEHVVGSFCAGAHKNQRFHIFNVSKIEDLVCAGVGNTYNETHLLNLTFFLTRLHTSRHSHKQLACCVVVPLCLFVF